MTKLGWHGERHRHSLAKHGVKTILKSNGYTKLRLKDIQNKYIDYVILNKKEALSININVIGWNYIVFNKNTHVIYGFPTLETLLMALEEVENNAYGETFKKYKKPTNLDSLTYMFYRDIDFTLDYIRNLEMNPLPIQYNNYSTSLLNFNNRIDKFTNIIKKLYPDFIPPKKITNEEIDNKLKTFKQRSGI